MNTQPELMPCPEKIRVEVLEYLEADILRFEIFDEDGKKTPEAQAVTSALDYLSRKGFFTHPIPPPSAEVQEAEDKDCYVSQPIGKDKDFDTWEKLHDTDRYYIRELKTKLSSERAQHKAWRKRAEEAEAAASTPKVELTKADVDAAVTMGIHNYQSDTEATNGDLSLAITNALIAANIIQVRGTK